ncbi:MAG: dTDP-4-keto-6-deoxy-D-glucose epimerase [Planctomycetes bacterium]|nr:dTDP-4-keto-6-deoxy-D-glucose epimerase [Planctomycetota bacterium]
MTPRFTLLPTPIDGLLVVERKPLKDARGSLERLYCSLELGGLLGDCPLAAINRTQTTQRGTVRGMHFQRAPHAELKLVSCLRGEVHDVAVDLRRDSRTFLQHHAVLLSAENSRSLLIPQGFAHGFQTLCDGCEMLYLHTASYHPESEDGLDAMDPRLSIAWPLPVSERSTRDQSHAPLDASFKGIVP